VRYYLRNTVKSGQNAAVGHYTQNISVNKPCKFIPEFG